MKKRRTKSVVVIGEGIPGTDLIRRYRVSNGRRVEIEPVYVAPRPIPPSVGGEIVRQARANGIPAVRYAGAITDTRPQSRGSRPSSTGFLGVYGAGSGGTRFVARVWDRRYQREVYIGTFDSAKDAAIARDDAVKRFGTATALNFPERAA